MSGDAVYVRRAMDGDLDEIISLERGIEFAPHWPRESYTQMVAGTEVIRDGEGGVVRGLFVAVQRMPEGMERVKGFCVGSVVYARNGAGGHEAELESVGVAAEARRKGVGRMLCDEVIKWARDRGSSCMNLEVRESSDAAIALYRRLGFVETGRRPGYYRSPDSDALLMQLDLGQDSFRT